MIRPSRDGRAGKWPSKTMSRVMKPKSAEESR